MSQKKRTPCPGCGRPAAGNFCQYCGESLGAGSCPECGAAATGAGRFCNECGVRLGASRSGTRRRSVSGVPGDVSWWVAGGALAVAATILAWNGLGTSAPPQAAVAAPPQPVAARPDLAQATPRQAADQLFNRVMTASDSGDPATVDQFLPLALSAYEAARPLDMDGLFHVALLQGVAGDPEASLATAQEMLAVSPTHILGLFVAAQAAAELDRDEEAVGYYRAVLENLDREQTRSLFEYETHSRYFEVTRQEALAFLSDRG